MGLLDDLKAQAETQQTNNNELNMQPQADAVDFYRQHVRLRMDAAFNYLKQLTEQVTAMKLVVKANYPFKPEGKPVTLQQMDYKVYSDSIPEPRTITLGFFCSLVNPAAFAVQGHGQVLAQSELLDRYQFKYEKQEQKDQRQMTTGAKFRLAGPLQVKFMLKYDDAKQIIKLLVANFSGPGVSQYNLKPEQLDEAFLDHLGKYILRKEANLFKQEISSDVKAMLRKKLQEEQMQRDSELKAAEEKARAEEAARRQNSTTGQLKSAVSHTVAENTEKLKKAMQEQVSEKKEKLIGMFNKLKKQAGFDSAPEQGTASPENPARSASMPATGAKPAPPAQKAADSDQEYTLPARPAAKPKSPVPPKAFQASSSNPYLKPEDFEPVARNSAESKEAQSDVDKIPGQTAEDAPVNTAEPNPFLPPHLQATPEKAQVDPSGQPEPDMDATVMIQNPFLPPKVSSANSASGLSLEPATSDTGSSSGLSLEPAASDTGSSPGLSLEPATSDTGSSSGLSLEPAAPDTGSSSGLSLEPAAPDTGSSSDLSLEQIEPVAESSSPATMTEAEPEHEAESSLDSPLLSLEDELERDLARLMGNDQETKP